MSMTMKHKSDFILLKERHRLRLFDNACMVA